MAEDLFFNKLVTKAMEAIHGDERFFEGYLTVEIKDKQGEITIVDELYKVLPIWMDRGAPISDTHSNRIIGKGINYSKTIYKDKDGEEYPAIKITGKIHKDYELDNEIWKKIKSGEYKGLSFGGATKSDRDPVTMKDGSIAYSLKDLEHYEVAVCADPAVPLALITDYNPLAKSVTKAEVREDGKMIIKCDKFGCYVTKPIPDGKGGKGDFDHCEEKNQDKNDPAAFCGAIQNKLEKAIEAGMLQQVAKNGLEIFLSKEELNKVCSTCGKTLEEHGVVKYDHSNSMGDQHSMYNQNSGRETWIGQGLPQPVVEGNDDNPAEQGLTINADAMQNSGKKIKKDEEKEKEVFDVPKKVTEGMNVFDEPKDIEADSILEDAKRYGTGTPRAADMYKGESDVWDELSDLIDYAKDPDKEEREKIRGGMVGTFGKSFELIFKREGANQAWGFKKDKLEPVLGNMQGNKSLVSIFKKKPETAKDVVQEALNAGEAEDKDCPWCQSNPENVDPEGSGKPKWWRDRANQWMKFTGSKEFGEWMSDHTYGNENIAQDKHDSDSKMHHTQAKKIPIERKGIKEGMSSQAGANVDTMSAMGFPPSKEHTADYKRRIDDATKVTEGQYGGAGQRGLGYGNEGYTNVQGSGTWRHHTITEIPPEMEIIVHDVDEIKESKKEGYTTEAGNNKRGDPSRATDDDDSLLNQTFVKT